MNTNHVVRWMAFFAFTTCALAEIPASLKPYADKFAVDCAALDSGREAQLKAPRERYLAVLSAAQKAAMAATKTADLAAIGAEIAGVNGNSLTADFPPDLPRALGAERRAYVAVASNLEKTIPPRQRDLASKYLQTLAALEAVALRARDNAVVEAIADEKKRVLGMMESAGGGQKNRNVITNGDFATGEANKWPPGWKQGAEDVSVPDACIVTEGTERFIRFRRLEAISRGNLQPEKEIPVPARAKWAEFSFRMRVKGYVMGKKEWDHHPGLKLSVRDARGEEVSSEWGISKQDTGWKRLSGRVEIPANGKTLRVSMGPHNSAGIVDFDDVVVEFR